MNRILKLSAAAIVVGVIGAALFAPLTHRPRPPAPLDMPSYPPLAASAPIIKPILPSPEPKAAATLADHIDQLLKSPRPADSYAAFQLLTACSTAREENNSHAAEICENITPGQIVSRRLALYRAAEAGVHGAVMATVSQGPDDWNLHAPMSATDPQTADWSQHVRAAIAAGVQTGDHFSIVAAAQLAEMPTEPGVAPDPERALMYWAALAEQARLRTGQSSPAFDAMLKERASKLPQERVQVLISQGKAIASIDLPEGITQ